VGRPRKPSLPKRENECSRGEGSVKLEDLKMLWPILTAVVMLSGFYYTTQLRLEQLESDAVELHLRVDGLEGRRNKLERDVRRLQKKVNK